MTGSGAGPRSSTSPLGAAPPKADGRMALLRREGATSRGVASSVFLKGTLGGGCCCCCWLGGELGCWARGDMVWRRLLPAAGSLAATLTDIRDMSEGGRSAGAEGSVFWMRGVRVRGGEPSTNQF